MPREFISAELLAEETYAALRQEITLSRELGLNSFPSLLLHHGSDSLRVEPDYLDADAMIKKIELFIRRAGHPT